MAASSEHRLTLASLLHRLGQDICVPWTSSPTVQPSVRPTRNPVVRTARPTLAPVASGQKFLRSGGPAF
jgi:hypothetical protein